MAQCVGDRTETTLFLFFFSINTTMTCVVLPHWLCALCPTGCGLSAHSQTPMWTTNKIRSDTKAISVTKRPKWDKTDPISFFKTNLTDSTTYEADFFQVSNNKEDVIWTRTAPKKRTLMHQSPHIGGLKPAVSSELIQRSQSHSTVRPAIYSQAISHSPQGS